MICESPPLDATVRTLVLSSTCGPTVRATITIDIATTKLCNGGGCDRVYFISPGRSVHVLPRKRYRVNYSGARSAVVFFTFPLRRPRHCYFEQSLQGGRYGRTVRRTNPSTGQSDSSVKAFSPPPPPTTGRRRSIVIIGGTTRESGPRHETGAALFSVKTTVLMSTITFLVFQS